MRIVCNTDSLPHTSHLHRISSSQVTGIKQVFSSGRIYLVVVVVELLVPGEVLPAPDGVVVVVLVVEPSVVTVVPVAPVVSVGLVPVAPVMSPVAAEPLADPPGRVPVLPVLVVGPVDVPPGAVVVVSVPAVVLVLLVAESVLALGADVPSVPALWSLRPQPTRVIPASADTNTIFEILFRAFIQVPFFSVAVSDIPCRIRYVVCVKTSFAAQIPLHCFPV
jgi:hypothetical protein